MVKPSSQSHQSSQSSQSKKDDDLVPPDENISQTSKLSAKDKPISETVTNIKTNLKNFEKNLNTPKKPDIQQFLTSSTSTKYSDKASQTQKKEDKDTAQTNSKRKKDETGSPSKKQKLSNLYELDKW